jgi:hypothetical protein
MSNIKTWVIRFYDKGTKYIARGDRFFIGTEEELKIYIKDSYERNNYLLNREVVYFERDNDYEEL